MSFIREVFYKCSSSLVCGLSFYSLHSIFLGAELPSFNVVQLTGFSFVSCASDVVCKNSWQNQRPPRFFSVLSSRRFVASHFIFRSVTYFEFVFEGCFSLLLFCFLLKTP